MIISTLIIIFSFLLFIPKILDFKKVDLIKVKISSPRNSARILLIWLVFGFFTRLDFNQMWGCIIYLGKPFDHNNILFFFISSGLIISSIISKNLISIRTPLFVELGFWLIRLFIYKGGYATGYTGHNPMGTVVFYDVTALFLRILHIQNTFDNKFLKHRTIWIIGVFVISMKYALNPIPKGLYWDKIRSERRLQDHISLIKGDWIGLVKYDSTYCDTLGSYSINFPEMEISELIKLKSNRNLTTTDTIFYLLDKEVRIIDSIEVSINDSLHITSKLFDSYINLFYSWGGDLVKTPDTNPIFGESINIIKISQDSLIFTTTHRYNFSLKRNNAR